VNYGRVIPAEFLSRPNRFIAHVRLADAPESLHAVHVKNTGRCRELLIPGVRVWLKESDNPDRKTKYSLITVEKAGFGLINLDSQAPNRVALEMLSAENPVAEIKREYSWGDSRLDFALFPADGPLTLIEVKGVTLERDGVAIFPDAPTERGLKHVGELMKAKASGFEARILFIIQMKGVTVFRPNDETHPAFGEALRAAKRAGVEILARDCIVTSDGIQADCPVPVQL
jgi:sugar fermentation stimulation protein A